jgi:hypothetical protein
MSRMSRRRRGDSSSPIFDDLGLPPEKNFAGDGARYDASGIQAERERLKALTPPAATFVVRGVRICPSTPS